MKVRNYETGGWQRAQSCPFARTDRLGINWRHTSACANAWERMESAGAVRRSARVCVPCTVTVWHRCSDLPRLGPCTHARRNIRLYYVTCECSMYQLSPIPACQSVGPDVCAPRAPVTHDFTTSETSSNNLKSLRPCLRRETLTLGLQL